jgi:ribonuclease D
VGYETLVRRIAKKSLDKSSRFTDWSRRPLTDAQKTYALADVTHLRLIYEHLAAMLETSGRARWVQEELRILTDPGTYTIEPAEAWHRVKTRNTSPKFLAVVRELAKFREEYAQTRNIPRSRIYKDDAMVELASTKPTNIGDLGRSRLLLREARKGELAEGILNAVQAGLDCPHDLLPKPIANIEKSQINPALVDLLRVLLKSKTEDSGVAAKLIASSADLDAIATGHSNVPAMVGWRREVFGEDALRLYDGKIGLAVAGKSIRIIEL